MKNKANKFLDCTNLFCPLPIVKTKKAMNEMNVGQVLEVTATDSGAVYDMKAWTKKTLHQLLHTEKVDGIFHFLIKKMH